jgi:hypothetical protein
MQKPFLTWMRKGFSLLLYSSASLIFAETPAGFSTCRPQAGRLLWFRRACPSTTLDKKVIYLIFMKEYGRRCDLSMEMCGAFSNPAVSLRSDTG